MTTHASFAPSRLAPAAPVVVVAFAARFATVLVAAGLRGSTGYDPGVYYAASASLVSGRLPYADFTLIHPPGITLLFAPFAILGRLTTDHIGFMTAAVASMAVGAANALLVFLVARRSGFGVRAGTLGGLFYALSFASLGAEYTTRLEPFGNFFVLLGVLAFVSYEPRRASWMSVSCGAALGAAASVKIWYCVPLLVVILATAVSRRGRRQVLMTGFGAVAAIALINGPFFLTAPTMMWRSVITDQLGRAPFATSAQTRLRGMFGLANVPLTGIGMSIVLAVSLGLVALMAWRAVRLPTGRLAVALMVTEAVTLLVSPSWFPFYSDVVVGGAALTIASAAAPGSIRQTGERPGRPRLFPVVAVIATALVTSGIDTLRPVPYTHSFPARQLRAVVADARCVQSDSPMVLIQLNVLTRDLDRGCPLWVDVTGRTYGVDLVRTRSGSPLARRSNPVWQRDLRHYFSSADAVIIVEASRTGFSAATLHAITAGRARHVVDGVSAYLIENRSPAGAPTSHTRGRAHRTLRARAQPIGSGAAESSQTRTG